MSDQEMNEINQQIANYVDKIMDSRKKLRVRGLPKNIPGGLPIMENFPGGVGVKKTKFDTGGKVINETKIVDIPTPPLGPTGAALKKAIGVFPFVGSAFKKGKKG
jgi:hypothetical protein